LIPGSVGREQLLFDLLPLIIAEAILTEGVEGAKNNILDDVIPSE
jgi:hypothetical protein